MARMSANRRSTTALNEFEENDFDGEWLQIGKFLRTMVPVAASMKDEVSRVRKKVS